jgi:hypothetical protein
MMNNKFVLLLVIFAFMATNLKSQDFTQLENGKNIQVVGMLVGFTVVKKETKKGSDLYRLTATITNQSSDYLKIFETVPESFNDDPQNALAYFQFTNANGKALSATNARFYMNPKYIKVPYSCKKCPPIKKDEDPYNHYTKSVIIGAEFLSGSTKSESYHIRVPEGEIPKVRVMVY